jgi:hypothetical protein
VVMLGASLGGWTVDWKSEERMDLDKVVGNGRYPYLSVYLMRKNLPDRLLRVCPAKWANNILDTLDDHFWYSVTYSLDFQLVPYFN